MFCSTIIPTVGRSTLTRAVNSVLSQNFDKDDFEVIVVNDSGKPLHLYASQSSPKVRIVNTQRRERSIARNVGAAIATGRHLHFLDDDDWLFQDALENFWNLSRTTQAAWLYGSSQLVERDGSELIQLHHGIQGNCLLQVMAGEWIPLQSSLIEANLFHQLGGFSPHITGPEDIDLLRRFCLYTDVAETPNLIAHIERGNIGSTTDYQRHPGMSRWAREKILSDEHAYLRMKDGANSIFWIGKFLRIYFTSVIWNIQQNKFTTACSRLMAGLAIIMQSNRRIFLREFWISLTNPYQSPTFDRGIKLSGRKFSK